MIYPCVINKPKRPGIDICLEKGLIIEMGDDVAIDLIKLIVNKVGSRKLIRINTLDHTLGEAMLK